MPVSTLSGLNIAQSATHLRNNASEANIDDYREVQDIIGEVKEHLSKVRGKPVNDINAPF